MKRAYRATTMGPHGMITTPHYLASQAGVNVLQNGGNAIEAAIAAASAIAQLMVDDLQANGGILTLNDFKNHTSDWVDPISVDYRGLTAYNLPPNTQGVASLSILNILNNFDLSLIKEGSAEYYHLMIEATKLAFADRDKWLTDPKFVDIPLNDLLSKSHGMNLAQQIHRDFSKVLTKQLDPKGDTVWFGVVDHEGKRGFVYPKYLS